MEDVPFPEENLYLCSTVQQLRLCLKNIAEECNQDIHVSIVLEDGSLEELFQGHEDDFSPRSLQDFTTEPLALYRLFVRSIHDIPGGKTERMVHWLSAPTPPVIESFTDTQVRCTWPHLTPIGFDFPPLSTSQLNTESFPLQTDPKNSSVDGFSAADVLNINEMEKNSPGGFSTNSEDGNGTILDPNGAVWPQMLYQLEVAEGRRFNPTRLTKYPSTTIPMEFRKVGVGPRLSRVTTLELRPCNWYFFRLRVLYLDPHLETGSGVFVVSEVASVATRISSPEAPMRPKAAVELVSNVKKARGNPQWRLRLHWTKPRSNGAPIQNYIVQQQVLGDGQGNSSYVHRPVSANLVRPATAFAGEKAVLRDEDLCDADGWLIIYEKTLPECDVPIPQGVGFHQLNLRVAAVNAVGQSSYSELLVITFEKLTAVLAEGDILACTVAKPPKLWIHHGRETNENRNLDREAQHIQQAFDFPVNLEVIKKFIKESDHEKKYKVIKDRRKLYTSQRKNRRVQKN
eukprot:CAMPEP_0117734986 /NCGR_PEP_ID=MMETSP0947-20121206/1012_1 /TAXON_ID=44440 /ORGANISM="Chattonella subsalsa, Strain CCMP2191" /LENGTH=513 /DNA_ID=CAMNT_0005549893 /DNA_START=97 /DNA_END=1638 /DNA_ORIENTATION=+